jgi:glycyl-tRNA synthetase beta subunit
MRSYLLDKGFRYDLVDAILSVQSHNPAGVALTLKELDTVISHPDWTEFFQSYARCVRITRDQKTEYDVKESGLVEDSEKELYSAIEKIEAKGPYRSFTEFYDQFRKQLVPVITRFFEKVMVMNENPVLMHNRLGMLQRISRLPKGLIDLSQLEGF